MMPNQTLPDPSGERLQSITDQDLILPLSSAEATLARVGGKGANLAILTCAGFQVPPGFMITTDAYRSFVSANQIGARLLSLAEAVSPDDPAALEATSEEIRLLFTNGKLPTKISEAILAAYESLSPTAGGHPPVAVRSSATAEDLPGLSFAGQQDTYLNIVGSEALIEAVISCWGSLWTARAMGYRARNHISPSDVALAVVVQAMIPSEVSGILFTANPLTGHRGETVIDASFGLGEAIVSGQVEPDHYVVNQSEKCITSRKLGAKALAILPRSEGGTESVTHDKKEQQALSDTQILDLARVAQRVAEHFGSPQDIEWAWAGGQLYLLQSRPITSLYPVPDSLLQSKNLRVLFSLNAVQGVVEPFTPLGQDIFPVVIFGILRAFGIQRPVRDMLIVAGGRLHVDATDMLSDKQLRKPMMTLLANTDPAAAKAVQALITSERLPTRRVLSLSSIFRLIVGAWPIITGAVMSWFRPEFMRTHAIKKADHYVARMQQAMDNATSLETRLKVLDQFGPNSFKDVNFIIAPVMLPGVAAQSMIDRWLMAWAGAEPGTGRQLMRGVPGNPTTEMDLKLWSVAQAIRSDPTAKALFRSQNADTLAKAYQSGDLSPVAQEGIKAFFAEYGQRAVGEIDMGRPRWREDPRSIIQNLSSYLQIDDSNLGPDHIFQKAGAEAEKLTTEYFTQVRQKKGRVHAYLFRAAIRRMRLLGGLREMPKFYMIKIFDLLRTAFLKSGQDLVTQGKLEHAEDIFFIPLDTLRSFVKGTPDGLKAVVNRGRADYTRELARRQIPRLLLSTGEVFYQGVSRGGTNDLVGDGVSPGTVEGKVRVVHDPRGVRLEPGEILVCPATDPGWTPLFLSAGGLVMELGGMMTHGSVVAREYGIPAVVGVHEATKHLKTGQRVHVDGTQGTVTILE
jgi:rifampicin phosphotransferase